MILTKWLTQKIINIALANDKTEKKDFFCYCINTLLEQILFAVTILLFGLLTNKITSCVLFLLLFTGFRLTSGGYHASKQWICTILSYICAIGTLIVSPLVPTGHPVIWLTIFSVLAFIIVKTPLVDHPNKRFTETEKQILKQKNYLFVSIVTFAEIVFCCTNYAIYYKLITISCFITVLNILAGIFKNRKEAYSSCYLK